MKLYDCFCINDHAGMLINIAYPRVPYENNTLWGHQWTAIGSFTSTLKVVVFVKIYSYL